MPQRNNIRRFESQKAQGEDSYVIFRRFTWGDERKFRKDIGAAEGEDAVVRVTLQTIADHLQAWNWADETGNPLPIPKTAEDFDDFNDAEMMFLRDSLQQLFSGSTDGDRKN